MAIDDLPPEMLREILEFVDTWTLLQCRLVNKKWLAISSEILCHRSEMEVKFLLGRQDDEFFQSCAQGRQKWFKDFTHTFKQAKNCPFVRFSFVDVGLEGKTLFFDHWIDFKSQFDISTIKCLKLDFRAFDDLIVHHLLSRVRVGVEDFNDRFVAYLEYCNNVKDLILFQLPNLEEFGLCLPQKTGAETLLPKTGIKCQVLPNLKVLHFQDYMFEDFPGISKRLLNDAVNLKRVQVGRRYHGFPISPVALEFLHSVGKLHLVREAEIQLCEDVFSTAKKYTNPPPDFKLTAVHISNQMHHNPNASSLEDAKHFLHHLFDSSKTSLRKLSMEPLGFFPGLQFSRLENVTELTLKSGGGRLYPFFPPGVRNLDVFSAVRHLDLGFSINCAQGFPSEEFIPILPRVKTLCVNDWGITGAHISVLALLCPNLTKFQIHRKSLGAPQLDFSRVGPSIWAHMKGLEQLAIDIDVDWQEHDSVALDSVFTGMTKETCQRLLDLEQGSRLLRNWQVEVEIPVSKLKAEREHPSILDMKDLKRLTVSPYSGEKLLDKKNLFKSKLSWISQEYAFELVPQLNLS